MCCVMQTRRVANTCHHLQLSKKVLASPTIDETPDCACCRIASVLGFLLSRVGFCMVAAVGKATEGDWSGVKIIASISLAISAGLLCLGVLSGRPTMQLLGSGLVLLGGLVFGMSAAWNRGCFIGTTVQLSGGNLGALWSVAGWIAGFRILPSQGIWRWLDRRYGEKQLPSSA